MSGCDQQAGRPAGRLPGSDRPVRQGPARVCTLRHTGPGASWPTPRGPRIVSPPRSFQAAEMWAGALLIAVRKRPHARFFSSEVMLSMGLMSTLRLPSAGQTGIVGRLAGRRGSGMTRTERRRGEGMGIPIRLASTQPRNSRGTVVGKSGSPPGPNAHHAVVYRCLGQIDSPAPKPDDSLGQATVEPCGEEGGEILCGRAWRAGDS